VTGQLLELTLVGHLTVAALDAAFAPLEARLRGGNERYGLVVDARRMTGYDEAARSRFVEWNHNNRHRMYRVAILTDKLAWKMVIATMALASKQQMKAFSSMSEAFAWLRQRG
jgi:hypothetical protein